MMPQYDVIVVGAGHAGCEAAAAAATMGSTVLLVTMNMQTIAQMSCNPAMGGIAKGQIVREIDALGGWSGIVTDISTVQFRMLNTSKGPGMWSPRAQTDRHLFAATWRQKLEENQNVHFWQDTVDSLIVSRGTVVGVVTSIGGEIKAKTVVLTTGTFLNGVIHIGERQIGGGRIGEKSATGITGQLQSLGFASSRLKTGTPPRIDGRSLDYSKMEIQPGDKEIVGFSFKDALKIEPARQLPCHITYTSEAVHDELRKGFDRSPMYQGRIEGTGPRYCPSIEDKINRFADKKQHQLFIEPEGWNTIEVYVNGFSTSLPQEVQMNALRLIKGFEQCRMFRPGYAIEYDYFPPTQLTQTLASKQLEGLYCAGQINGTTGYEEAACQGLMAGMNAHLAAHGKEPFFLRRDQAYIGVLIDDLINKGTDEPYRMFTSRAEFRTLLRQDNADERLTPAAYTLGLADEDRLRCLEQKQEKVQSLRGALKSHFIEPENANGYLSGMGSAPLKEKTSLAKLLLRPEAHLKDMAMAIPEADDITSQYTALDQEQAEIQIKYESYILKERELADKMLGLEGLLIPKVFDYQRLTALSFEARQKLAAIRPETLGQASRISGVNPTDVQILMVSMGR